MTTLICRGTVEAAPSKTHRFKSECPMAHLIYIAIFWLIVVIVIDVFGMIVIGRGGTHEHDESRLSQLTCRLWCEDVRGQARVWESSSRFDMADDVIGIWIEPAPPPWLVLTACDETGAYYALYPGDEPIPGILYKLGSPEDSLKGMLIQSVVLRLIHIHTKECVCEFVWDRAQRRRKAIPDPEIIALLESRTGMFGRQ